MPGSSFRAWLMIAALLAAAATAGYDIYLHKAAPVSPPTVVHDPPTAADLAKATEPMRKELEAAKLRLAAIAADRDNLKQQLDALQKPARRRAGRQGQGQGQGQGRRGHAETIGRGDAATRCGAVRGRGLEAAHPAIGGAAAPRAGAAGSRCLPPAAKSIRNDRSPNCASFMPAARRRRARHRRPTKPANGSRPRACGSSASPAAAFCC